MLAILRTFFLTVLLHLATPFGLQAGDTKMEKEADRLYAIKDFKQAVKGYQKVLTIEPDNAAAKEKIAHCYRWMNQPIQAEKWYAELVKDPGAVPTNKYFYAQVLAANGKYERAIKYFSEYMIAENKAYINDLPMHEKKWLDLMEQNNLIEFKYLPEVNTAQSDFSPIFFRDSSILFVSDVKSKIDRPEEATNTSCKGLYASYRGMMKSADPRRFQLSSAGHEGQEGPIAFTKEGETIFFTRSRCEIIKEKQDSAGKKNTLKVYKASYEKSMDLWSRIIEAFPFNSSEYNVCDPAFSADNQYVIFASDMPGGYGGYDLWITQYNGDAWSKPKNLGPNINTKGVEKFPFISALDTLYFASDGHFGLGGLDIYKSKVNFERASCDFPQNMGIPFNSSKDDFGFIVHRHNLSGYFSSNRPGGWGKEDIYYWGNKPIYLKVQVNDEKNRAVKLTELKLLCKGMPIKQTRTDTAGLAGFEVVRDCSCTLKVSKADYKPKLVPVRVAQKSVRIDIKLDKLIKPEIKLEITVLNKENNEPMQGVIIDAYEQNSGDSIHASTDREGKLLIAGVKENIELEVRAHKVINSEIKKILAQTMLVSTMGKVAPVYMKKTIYLEEAELYEPIHLPQVHFDQSKYELKESGFADLDKIVKIMKDNPTIEIEIGSHTDCRGSTFQNMNLSAKRAEAVSNYLVSKGIDIKRIITVGYGESELLNDDKCEGASQSVCSVAEHRQNQRTEIKILAF